MIGISLEGAGIDHPGRGVLWIEMEHLDELPLDGPEFPERFLAHAEYAKMKDLSQKRLIPLGITLQHGQAESLLHPADPENRPPKPFSNFLQALHGVQSADSLRQEVSWASSGGGKPPLQRRWRR